MTRNHRHWHFWLWVVLTPLMAAGLVAALTLREVHP
jgi:hypothetical protein